LLKYAETNYGEYFMTVTKLQVSDRESEVGSRKSLFSRFTLHVSRFLSKIQNPKSKIPLLLFPLLFIAAALFSPFNIGYRHLLPVLPFLYVGIGQMVGKRGSGRAGEGERGRTGEGVNESAGERGSDSADHPSVPVYRLPSTVYSPHASRFTFHVSHFLSKIQNPKSKIQTLTLLALLFWQVAGTFLIAPHYLTFFNEVVGKENGWRYLADSNTDWGQGYKELARYQQARGLGSVQLAGFVFYDPAAYGVTYTGLTPLPVAGAPAVFPGRLAPPPGDYVIGATVLDGIPLADPEMYDWFRRRDPDAVIAGALRYYHVAAEETAVAWVAQCITPTIPLDAAALAGGFARAGVRQIAFDCSQSWVFPAGLAAGQSAAGVYVLHGAWGADSLAARLYTVAPAINDPFMARRLETAKLVYRQRAYRDVPAFAVYRSAVAPAPPLTGAWPAPAETSPAQLRSQAPAPASQQLDGPLAFLGLTVERNAAGLDIATWWRVTDYPAARPVSIFAHLLTVDGAALGGADGLGIPTAYWQPGDVLVQRHVFPLSPEQNEAAAILRTGVYGLDDGQRWAVVAGPEGADALFAPLEKEIRD